MTVIAIVMICAMAGAGTMAYFTSSSSSANNTFNTGTLILGGKDINGNNLYNTFVRLQLGNMEPGEPPIKVSETILKNVGTLPFYLYRMTATALADNTNNGINDTILNNVLMVDITIGGEPVFHGRLSQLVEENGGFFDPIYNVNPTDERLMVITAYMDPTASNQYQGLSMSCDLTVYASQNGSPITGQPSTQPARLGTTPHFAVDGYENGSDVWFDWNWTPDDRDGLLGYEEYWVRIKHETGDSTTEIYEVKISLLPTGEWVTSTDGISASAVSLDSNGDIVRIKKSAFPASWQGFEVQFGGRQRAVYEVQETDYTYWTLNRTL